MAHFEENDRFEKNENYNNNSQGNDDKPVREDGENDGNRPYYQRRYVNTERPETQNRNNYQNNNSGGYYRNNEGGNVEKPYYKRPYNQVEGGNNENPYYKRPSYDNNAEGGNNDGENNERPYYKRPYNQENNGGTGYYKRPYNADDKSGGDLNNERPHYKRTYNTDNNSGGYNQKRTYNNENNNSGYYNNRRNFNDGNTENTENHENHGGEKHVFVKKANVTPKTEGDNFDNNSNYNQGGYNNNRNNQGGGYPQNRNNYNQGGGGYNNNRNNQGGGGYNNNRNNYNQEGGGYPQNRNNYNQGGGGYNNNRNNYNQGGGYPQNRNNYNNNQGGGGYNNNRNNYNQEGGNKPFVRKTFNTNNNQGGGYQQRGGYNNNQGGGYQQRGGFNNNRNGGGGNRNFQQNRNRFSQQQPQERQYIIRYEEEELPDYMPNVPETIEIRLNKYIAQCGICGRRDADDLIRKGMVKVNGELVDQMGIKINPQVDVITYNGKDISRQQKVYILYNKPKNVISTTDDEKDRRTVLDEIEEATSERVYPVGRLDRDTTGLIILTNDGDLTEKLTHPSNDIRKVYHVTVSRELTTDDLDRLREGIELEDGLAKVDKVEFIPDRPLHEVLLEIHIGRNRIVRRMFDALDAKVYGLDRVKLAHLTKKGLARSKWRMLSEKEIAFLKML